jgi:hypothetical protein
VFCIDIYRGNFRLRLRKIGGRRQLLALCGTRLHVAIFCQQPLCMAASRIDFMITSFTWLSTCSHLVCFQLVVLTCCLRALPLPRFVGKVGESLPVLKHVASQSEAWRG